MFVPELYVKKIISSPIDSNLIEKSSPDSKNLRKIYPFVLKKIIESILS